MSLETVISHISTLKAFLWCIVLEIQLYVHTLAEPFSVEGLPLRMLTSLQDYGYVFVPAATIFLLDCISTCQIWKYPSNKTLHEPEAERRIPLAKLKAWPSFEGATRGYYNDCLTNVVFVYVMVAIALGFLLPDAWRRLGYTVFLWFPLFFYSMKMVVSFTDLHSILWESHSRCNITPAIFSCALMRRFPRVTEVLRISFAATVTTSALWYEMPAAQSIVFMSIIHNESNITSYKRGVESFGKLICYSVFNLFLGKAVLLWSAYMQGFIFPIRVCSQHDNIHTNWTLTILGSVVLCTTFQLIFRFYMYGFSDLAIKSSQDTQGNSFGHPVKFSKIYFYTSIIAFFLSYILLAMLKAVSFLDGSFASGGLFMGCIASLLIPLSVQIVALARGESTELWQYELEWEKLDGDDDDDENADDDG